jgi:alkanesulfonate monooxygenase SsuD/methylene tetrahydromethanopterin reductase-like flavin-dependent oxidoreductase (luciferase family)
MKVGGSIICQNFFKAEEPDEVVYAEDLRIAEMYEGLGFDSIWTVEHHFSPYTMVPDGLQMLSYLCGRTKTIGLGSMVVVLPWHDPVRVAEQFAMLSHFARGRELTLGVGRGAGRIEFDGMRIPMSESRERFVEAAEILQRALSNERFSFSGKYYQIPEMSIRPQPLDKNMVSKMYGAIVSPETGDIMAQAGIGMLIIPQKPWSEHLKDFENYKVSCAKYGREAKRPISVCWVYCHEDAEKAREGAHKWMGNYTDTALRHYEFDEPEHFRNAKGYESYVKNAEMNRATNGKPFRDAFAGTQVFGTPEQCIDSVRAIVNSVDASEFVAVFKYGGMPVEEAERSVRVFAKEVLPEIHRMRSGDPTVSAAAGR